MTKNKKETNGKNRSRTQVKDLPRKEKELSKEEQKKVKGGSSSLMHNLANKPKQ